jgi:hypothetical protein
MECYCDYDAPEFYRVNQRKARKPHRCGECHRTIQPGERYTVCVGKWDGHLSEHHRCTHCEAVWKALNDRFPCYCWYWGGLYEDEGFPEYLAALREAKTGDYFAVLRRIAAAKQARRA